MSHTPGPWRYDIAGAIVLANDDQMSIADIRGFGFLSKRKTQGEVLAEIDANGKLIAAAPDLLEACKRALTMDCVCPESDDIKNELRAAIAKAEQCERG